MVVGKDILVGTAIRRRLHGSGDRFPVGATFSAPVQTVPGTHTASYTMVTVLSLRLKQPGCGINHSPHLTPSLKN